MDIPWDYLALGITIGGLAVFFVMLVMVNAKRPAPKPPALTPARPQREVYRAAYELHRFQPRAKQ